MLILREKSFGKTKATNKQKKREKLILIGGEKYAAAGDLNASDVAKIRSGRNVWSNQGSTLGGINAVINSNGNLNSRVYPNIPTEQYLKNKRYGFKKRLNKLNIPSLVK